MLETISRGFRAAKQRLSGVAELTDDVIDEALRDVRMSLLEADVDFKVTKGFLERVKEKARGEEVKLRARSKEYGVVNITPEQAFIKICQDELTAMMGPVETELRWAKKGPTGIMMVGLQGSGKTTTVGKLARFIEKKHNKKPLLVAADVYRPAAIEQLKVLGNQLSMPVFSEAGKTPPEICEHAMQYAREKGRDVVIFDTAGRLAIDEPLMKELEEIDKRTQPANIFLVVDAMIGQDAVNTANAFHDRLNIDGVILTKLDGDARGGAALSIKEVTGKPIKFLGMGESLDKLEEFRPEGLASRILGMGDIVGLVKDFEQVVDEKKAEEDAKKLLSGNFSMKDFVEQIRTVRKMGPLKDLLEKFPIFGEMTEQLNPDEKELGKIEAMYDSMTEKERLRPSLIDDSRMTRIARGSGRKKTEVQELLQKHGMMQQVMGAVGQNPGLLGRIPGFKQLGQLSKLKNMDLSQVFGKDAKMMEQALS